MEELKQEILKQYKSVRAFSMASGLAYTTVDSILRKGLAHASIANVIKICDALDISADALAIGKIEKRQHTSITPIEFDLVCHYRDLNKLGKDRLMEYANLLVNDDRMKSDLDNVIGA